MSVQNRSYCDREAQHAIADHVVSATAISYGVWIVWHRPDIERFPSPEEILDWLDLVVALTSSHWIMVSAWWMKWNNLALRCCISHVQPHSQ